MSARRGSGGGGVSAPSGPKETPMSSRVLQKYEALLQDLRVRAVRNDSSPTCRQLLRELRRVYTYNSKREVCDLLSYVASSLVLLGSFCTAMFLCIRFAPKVLALQQVFLKLLDQSVKCIVVKRNLERKLHFGVVVSLLLREEFRYHSVIQHIGKGNFQILAGYTHQLSMCMQATIACLQDITEYSDAATINSCMKILAIAFIRLPKFREIYEAELDQELALLLAVEEESSQADSTKRVLDACDRYERVAEIKSKDPIKRREFMKQNADVFGWEDVEELLTVSNLDESIKNQFQADQAQLVESLTPGSQETARTFRVALKSSEGFYYFLTNYLKVC